MTSGLRYIWPVWNKKTNFSPMYIKIRWISWPVDIVLKEPSAHTLCRTAFLYSDMNSHRTFLCLNSFNISKEFFEGTGTPDITQHNNRTFLSTAHTHTHTHTHIIKHCVNRGGEEIIWFVYEQKNLLFNKEKSPPQWTHQTVEQISIELCSTTTV